MNKIYKTHSNKLEILHLITNNFKNLLVFIKVHKIMFHHMVINKYMHN
jgi:hypothetical protein